MVLLIAFIALERHSVDPLLPLRLVTDRTRAGVYLSQALSIMSMFGLMLFLTYDLQTVNGLSPLLTGVAFLPLVVGMLAGASVIAPRVPRASPRTLMTLGSLVAASGMAFLTTLQPESSYWEVVFPATGLFGLGLGIAFPSAMLLATYKVDTSEIGVASGLINASQQVGGAIGAAALNTIAATSTALWIASNSNDSTTQATVQGYVIGAQWALWFLLLSAVLAFILVRTPGLTATSEHHRR